MDLVSKYLPILVILAFVGVGAWLIRRMSGGGRQASALATVNEVSMWENKYRMLESKYQEQLEFIINFPESVRALTAAMSVPQVTSACSRSISALLNSHRSAIFVVNRGQLQLLDGAGFPNQLRGQVVPSPAELGLDRLLKTRGVHPLNAYPVAVDSLRKLGIQADVGVPMWHGDRLVGLLLVANVAGDAVMAHRVLAMLADLTGVALNAASRVKQIQDERDRDQLTGLPNRRMLMNQVEAELQRCRAYGSACSLAMIDIDHFKICNDTNGHAAGDEILKGVASLMAQTTRRTDLVARYGGEEFTLLLRGAQGQSALQQAERVRKTIASHEFPQGKTQPLGIISISVGVATFPHHAETSKTLFEAADQALYVAKERGRNRVIGYNGQKIEAKQQATVPPATATQTTPPETTKTKA